MARPISLLALLGVFLAVLPYSTAVKCYTCADIPNELGAALDGLKGVFDAVKDVLPPGTDSGNDAGSSGNKSPFDFKNLHPSCKEFDPENERFRKDCSAGCMKVVNANGEIARDCFSLAMDRCDSKDGSTTCVCKSDYCNVAGHSAPALPLLLLLLPVALLALLNSRL